MYEIFEHTADLGIRVKAATLEQLFADAARGLFAVMAPAIDNVRPVQEKRLSLKADGLEFLLLDWLSELLYAFESERLVLTSFEVRFDGSTLSAICRGGPFDPERHGGGNEVKAITYHGLLVQQEGQSWRAEVIVDI